MKIALVHSFYSRSQPSGENVVVDAQLSALSERFEVALFATETDDRRSSPLYPVEAALTVATGFGRSPRNSLSHFSPDLIHVHNLFPNFGNRWLRSVKVPIVATLHNFRHSCAAGTFYRDGGECTDCLEVGSSAALANSCYRRSKTATLPLSITTRGGARGDLLINSATRIITLSERARRLHELAGVQPSKMRVLPNFVEMSPVAPSASTESRAWLYMGRLAEEKGVVELVKEWPQTTPLDIVGDGPLREFLEKTAPGNVNIIGPLGHGELGQRLQQYEGVLLPSRWAEGAIPLTYVEAITAGLPVIALAGNGAADDVIEGATGVVVRDWSELPTAIATIAGNRPMYSDSARRRALGEYSKDRWLSRISRLYDEALRESNLKRHGGND